MLTRHSTVSNIHTLLDPPHSPVVGLLRARAISNVRLVCALDIHNTFVSDDPRVQTAFRKQTSELVSAATRRGWLHFQAIALQAIDIYLVDTSLEFDTFVQGVTFIAVIAGLLHVDIDITERDRDDIAFITRGITKLWHLSKTSHPSQPNLLNQLNRRISRFIPDHEQFPSPLDVIIPAWEPLWRVVAIALAHVHNDEPARRAFRAFHGNPTVDQFREYIAAGPSMEGIVLETLRLYPPTRRITRAVIEPPPPPFHRLPAISRFLQRFRSAAMRYEVADIEAAQRSPIWGPSASVFDPMRHHSSREQQGQQLLAFGYGRLGCIASTWAPMAAGVITSAILERLDAANHEVGAGGGIGGREGWGGWSIRRT